MKFSTDSVPLSTLLVGEACRSEYDVDDNNTLAPIYVVDEKDGKRISVTVIDPKSVSKSHKELPGAMKVCKKID